MENTQATVVLCAICGKTAAPEKRFDFWLCKKHLASFLRDERAALREEKKRQKAEAAYWREWK